MEYEQRSFCLAVVREALATDAAPTELEQRLADELTNQSEVSEPAPDGSALRMRLGRWVIRDEDLKLFGAIRDSLVALAAVGFAFKDLPVATLVSVGLATSTVLLGVWRNIGRVKPDALVVLLALQHLGGSATIDEIHEAINPKPPTREKWSRVTIRAHLEQLGTVPTRADVIAVVKPLADGHWVVVGI